MFEATTSPWRTRLLTAVDTVMEDVGVASVPNVVIHFFTAMHTATW